jgi:hypothetical protein
MKTLPLSAIAVLVATSLQAEGIRTPFAEPVPLISLSRAIVFTDQDFLELLGDAEAPAGYDAVTHSTRLRPTRPITELTLAEVMAFQRKVIAAGASSSAMGRYQFLHRSLKALIELHGIDESRLFDKTMQDYLARLKLKDCGFYDLRRGDAGVAQCLAGTWAALPAATGKGTGKSRYHGINGNKSRVGLTEVLATIESSRPAPEN